MEFSRVRFCSRTSFIGQKLPDQLILKSFIGEVNRTERLPIQYNYLSLFLSIETWLYLSFKAANFHLITIFY